MFTPRELEILAEGLGELMEEEDWEDCWSAEDQEVMIQLRDKLDPQTQSEILDLEKRLALPSAEGEG